MSPKKPTGYIVLLVMLFFLALYAWMKKPVHLEGVGPGATFVHLFEWTWPDIALECETFLGPQGYSAVQISPPQEHVTGEQWWTRYQPVSYQLESRGGTRVEFEEMVRRCRAAGVEIYADAVINHMSGVGEGVGVAGSVYGRYRYPVPYDFDEFHHCGRHGDDSIRNYQDAWEVRNCELVKLTDLNTGDEGVQGKIAAYLRDLVGTGVAGFRVDAAKHMEPADLAAILDLLQAKPFIFQEVIDRSNEPITGSEYAANGHVTEFKYGMELFTAFSERDLSRLQSLGSAAGWMPSGLAVVFVDNHDEQRSDGGLNPVLTYREGDAYELANIFMLAWPYGYPRIMSSYRFSEHGQGPPMTKPVDDQGNCSAEWVCEHRNPAIAAMVDFRAKTRGQPVTGWTQIDTSAIAFSRSDSGFVAINAGNSAVTAQVPVGLKPGLYRDLLRNTESDNAEGDDLLVGEDQTVTISLPPMSAIATHKGVIK